MTVSNTKTILIVEDDKDILFTVSLFLESEGYTVQTAENGAIALELLKSSKSPLPHLILLDMMMPVLNGWQFAAEFHKQFDDKSPIVVMTAAANAEQRAKDIGAKGWIGKPFLLEDLLKLIEKHARVESVDLNS
jgi:CheY-like chemotaxis protein